MLSYYNYATAIDSPENKRFVEAYRKRFESEPAFSLSVATSAARAIIEAAKAGKGDLSDMGAFLSALRSVQFDGPAGRFRFDADQRCHPPVYRAGSSPARAGSW